MNLSALVLKIFGWKVNVATPLFPKSIICVAPHTSNWDFILGELAIHSVNLKSGFLMKESWFFFPLGNIFRAMGGIPVPRKNKKESVTEAIVEKFNNTDTLNIAITPEGTRKPTNKWRTGFLYIAYKAKLPILLASIDYKAKTMSIDKIYEAVGDADIDIANIKEYYRSINVAGRFPERFLTGPQ